MGGTDGEEFVGGEDGGGEVVGGEESFGEAEVELGGEELAVDFVGVGDEEGDLDVGVVLAELGDEGREEVGAYGEAGAEEECAAVEALEFLEGAGGFGFD